MSFLGDLLGAPNSSATLASSSTSSAGGSVTIVAPAMVRKKSGYFDISAVASVTTPGSGPQGVTFQLISSLIGNIGPAVPWFGTSGVSTTGSVRWIDITSILVGQPVQYSVKITPVSSSNSIALGTSAGCIVVDELGGPTPPQ